MKECRSCRESKEDREFYKRASNLDGLYSYCKSCVSVKSKVTHTKYKKERNEKAKKRYIGESGEILRENARKYYYEHKEHVLKKRAEYRGKYKDKISLREAKKRLNDPNRFERNRNKHLDWREQNLENINAYQRAWYQKNKEKRKAHVMLNRAIKSGKIMRPGNCSKCCKICKPDGHHEDYKNPLIVIWLCRACHSRMSPRTVIK